jgi:hypothetical protein
MAMPTVSLHVGQRVSSKSPGWRRARCNSFPSNFVIRAAIGGAVSFASDEERAKGEWLLYEVLMQAHHTGFPNQPARLADLRYS